MAVLRVVSYNVHRLRDDLGALRTVVRDLAPDVLVVQEAPRGWRWRQRCADLARELGLFYAAGGLPAVGNLILAGLRVRVHDTGSVRFPLTPGRHLRGVAIACCSLNRVPFAVAGSHLSTHADERPRQATVLKKTLRELDLPFVLGIDVNETATGPAWRIVADGLVDLAAAAGDERCTFSSVLPRYRIDALFADPRLTLRGYQVVQTSAARAASDHFPVVADLDL